MKRRIPTRARNGSQSATALAKRRLIAAAPDLLDVLGYIMAEWDSDPRSTQCFDAAIIRKARAAIAKAEGR